MLSLLVSRMNIVIALLLRTTFWSKQRMLMLSLMLREAYIQFLILEFTSSNEVLTKAFIVSS